MYIYIYILNCLWLIVFVLLSLSTCCSLAYLGLACMCCFIIAAGGREIAVVGALVPRVTTRL